MQFEQGSLYHIYNQGNNKQKIFFTRENYHYFTRKLKTYITPYADILAWCLMPNHFHVMVKVNHTAAPTGGFALTEGFAQSETLGKSERTFNQSIGIMLRSYTVAINKQEGRSGSLFRKETKAKCLDVPVEISPSYFQTYFGTRLNVDISDIDYPQRCFDYIHQNPVEAGLVTKPEDWEFSSASAFLNVVPDNLVNLEVAKEEGLIYR